MTGRGESGIAYVKEIFSLMIFEMRPSGQKKSQRRRKDGGKRVPREGAEEALAWGGEQPIQLSTLTSSQKGSGGSSLGGTIYQSQVAEEGKRSKSTAL